MLIPYLPYLVTRYQEGCHNMQQLWLEIKAQGYLGSDNGIYNWTGTYRDKFVYHDSQEPLARANPA